MHFQNMYVILKCISLRDYLVIFEKLAFVMSIDFLLITEPLVGLFLVLLVILLKKNGIRHISDSMKPF